MRTQKVSIYSNLFIFCEESVFLYLWDVLSTGTYMVLPVVGLSSSINRIMRERKYIAVIKRLVQNDCSFNRKI